LVFQDPDPSGSQPSALRSRLLRGPAVDQIFAAEDALGEVIWPLADHLNTVRDFVDSSGVQLNHRQFDSFGNLTAESNPAATDYQFTFTGGYQDPLTGLIYRWNRWYDPSIGRWQSEDPIGFNAGDANVTRYVKNAATTVTDPSGLVVPNPDPLEWWRTGEGWSAFFGSLWNDASERTETLTVGMAEVLSAPEGREALGIAWQETRVRPLGERWYRKACNYAGEELESGTAFENYAGIAAIGDITALHQLVEGVSGYDQASFEELDDVPRGQALSSGIAGAAALGANGLANCPRANMPLRQLAAELVVDEVGGLNFSGTCKPWTSGATPNSKYTHIGPDGKAVQNAIYDANGNVIGHVDFKNHGPGAPSGHGHEFPTPGNPASGHGPGLPHILPSQLPPGWGDLPPGVAPRTPIGQ
jgi:RHS repeat-associated protein